MFDGPVLIDSWIALQHLINLKKSNGDSKSNNTLTREWYLKNGIRPDPKTLKFPDNCGRVQNPVTFIYEIWLFFLGAPMYGFFVLIPALLYYFFKTLPAHYATALVILMSYIIYILPTQRFVIIL